MPRDACGANASLDENWLYCPICRKKTRVKIRDDTVLCRFPLFCPKCRREMLIDVMKTHITIIKEPGV